MIAIGNLRLGQVQSKPAQATRHFFGPITDFLLLGGLSLFLLPIALIMPSHFQHEVWLATWLLALVINHPHFAHSYQIFYRGFHNKAYGEETKRSLRLRYLFAGIAVPVALVAFLTGSVVVGDLKVLGIAANVMGLTVGWHYVKQGYGMLIVDGVQQKQFFSESERRVLLANAYAAWALAWLTVNTASRESALFGIEYFSLGLPTIFLSVALGVVILTSVATGVMLSRRWLSGKGLPAAGVTAYLVTLYLWTAFVRINPIWLLIVPALHSLQYLTIVWRHEYTRASNLDDAFELPTSDLSRKLLGRMQKVHFAWFVFVGFVLGLLGFWIVPVILEVAVPLSSAEGVSVYLFAFWIFINVHHYFIDNVIWRSENADVKKYLFGEARKAPVEEEALPQAA